MTQSPVTSHQSPVTNPCPDCGQPMPHPHSIFERTVVKGEVRWPSRYVCDRCHAAWLSRRGHPSQTTGLPLFQLAPA